MTLQFTNLESEKAISPEFSTTLNQPTHSSSGYRAFGKRSLDVALVVLSLPIVLPLILLMALCVMMEGQKPFYSQMRVGRDGRHFRIWKIRTMTSDADERLEAYLTQNPDARLEWDLHQKLKNDPRVTLCGRFLRKSSLDELPQLLNVLFGSMSLVGPRPMMVCQEKDYLGKSYFKMSPGITGLWQVSDRNQTSFAARVHYDETYHRIASLKVDLLVLWRTVAVVLRGTGC